MKLELTVTQIGFTQYEEGIVMLVSENKKFVSILLGKDQVVSIACALSAQRRDSFPLNYLLLSSILKEFNTSLGKIEICMENKTAYGLLYIKKPDGEEVIFKSIAGEAIALALEWKAPIFMEEDLIKMLTEENLEKEDFTEELKLELEEEREGDFSVLFKVSQSRTIH